MHTFLRAGAAAVVGATALVASTGAAGADPKGETFEVTCGGTEYDVVVMGNGGFTPAHDVASNAVLVPVAFGPFTGTLTDLTTGQVVFTETEPGTTKGNSQPPGRTVLECTFSFHEEFVAGADDEGLIAGHRYRFHGVGEVTGFASGAR